MLKKLFSLPIILMLSAHSADQNYSANGVTLKSIDSATTEMATQLIADYNIEMGDLLGDNAVTIGNIVPNQLKRKENGNAWHLQLVFADTVCVGLLAFGKIPTSYDKAEHQPLHQAFRTITDNTDAMATCVWAFNKEVSTELKVSSFKTMVDYARHLKANHKVLPLSDTIPQHLFVLTSDNDSQTQDLLRQAGLTLSANDAWTLFYDKPRVAGHTKL
ncbi:MAG: hypothetical protein KF820_04710 [Candidatus Paracaedibacteraceae bacterium]|nr:hypothetical protein [Candidatus Paracaedibacteraceae bacterium]